MYPSLLIGLALAVGAPAPKDPPKADPLVGEWTGEKVIVEGKLLPPAKGLEGLRLVITADGKLTMHRPEEKEKPETLKYTHDPARDPAEIDMTFKADPKEPPAQGIYKIEGEFLTLALGVGPGSGRPKKFESADGSGVWLMTFKRAKK